MLCAFCRFHLFADSLLPSVIGVPLIKLSLARSFFCSFVARVGLVYIYFRASNVSATVLLKRMSTIYVFSQAEILDADQRMLEMEDFISGPLSSWLVSFVEWAENSTDYR